MGAKLRFPYKIISDSGGGLRDDFVKELKGLGIAHKPSSAYHSASKSLAERAVQHKKSVWRNSTEKLDKLRLGEICFAINSHVSQEGSGTIKDF